MSMRLAAAQLPPLQPSSWAASSRTDCKSKRETTHQQRLFYLDLVRAAALICNLDRAFQRDGHGVFTLPHKLLLKHAAAHLSEISASLSLCPAHRWHLDRPAEQNPCAVLQKGARWAAHPLFWLAWLRRAFSQCRWRTPAASAGPEPSRWC